MKLIQSEKERAKKELRMKERNMWTIFSCINDYLRKCQDTAESHRQKDTQSRRITALDNRNQKYAHEILEQKSNEERH